MMATVEQWITSHGYVGLFLLLVVGMPGVPVPMETLLTFSGFLIYKGDFGWGAALAWAGAGGVCGITLSYVLGSTCGWWLIHKVSRRLRITEDHFEKVQRWFDRYGRWTLVFGYFIPGFRHAIGYVSGMTRMRYRNFALFAYTGSALWGASFMLLGYLLGPAWQDARGWVSQGHAVLLWVLGTLVGLSPIAWFLWRLRRS